MAPDATEIQSINAIGAVLTLAASVNQDPKSGQLCTPYQGILLARKAYDPVDLPLTIPQRI